MCVWSPSPHTGSENQHSGWKLHTTGTEHIFCLCWILFLSLTVLFPSFFGVQVFWRLDHFSSPLFQGSAWLWPREKWQQSHALSQLQDCPMGNSSLNAHRSCYCTCTNFHTLLAWFLSMRGCTADKLLVVQHGQEMGSFLSMNGLPGGLIWSGWWLQRLVNS